MGFETIHAARHMHATESFPPRDGVGLVAGPSRKRIRRFGAPTDEAVNLFLDVDGRLFHGVFRISRDAGQSKDTENGSRDNLLIGFYLSFSDKKDLTNGIDWFIPCGMNANLILINVGSIVFGSVIFVIFYKRMRSWRLTSPKDTLASANVKLPSPRLKRIQDCGYLLSIASLTAAVLGALGTLLLIFLLVRNGTIFNLSQHGLLGDVGVIVFVLTLTLEAWFCHKLFQQYARGNLFTKVVVHYIYQIGRFYVFAAVEKYFLNRLWEKQHFQFSAGDSIIPIYAGFLIIFIAWIMDEGRKIQEEQELTV
jgi:hypothetical protein